MNILKKILIISVLILCVNAVFSQTKKDLEKKKNKTQDEINYTNKLLQQTKDNQKTSYNDLLLINKNIEARKSIINDINSELSFTSQKIKDIELIISIMQEDLEKLKLDYARMVKLAWKNSNKYNTIMFILSSKDFNQSYLRLKYMQQIAKFRERQFKAINSINEILKIQIQKLNSLKKDNIKLLDEQKGEEKKLVNDQKKQEKTINQLKSQETELKKKLADQQKQMAQIQKEIENIIREEAKKNTNVTTGKYELTPAEKIVSTNFANNKGKLPWPVERGVIVDGFGKKNHPVYPSVVLENKGVDISTTVGASARAIFEGEVKKVLQLPGAVNAVIIGHGEYMTVYTNLDNIVVTRGEKVLTKQVIGKVHTNQNDNKTVLHLEIWKASDVVNPALWLAK